MAMRDTKRGLNYKMLLKRCLNCEMLLVKKVKPGYMDRDRKVHRPMLKPQAPDRSSESLIPAIIQTLSERSIKLAQIGKLRREDVFLVNPGIGQFL